MSKERCDVEFDFRMRCRLWKRKGDGKDSVWREVLTCLLSVVKAAALCALGMGLAWAGPDVVEAVLTLKP